MMFTSKRIALLCRTGVAAIALALLLPAADAWAQCGTPASSSIQPADGSTIPTNTNYTAGLQYLNPQGAWAQYTPVTNITSPWTMTTCPNPGLGQSVQFRWQITHGNYFVETGSSFTCQRGPQASDLTNCTSPGPIGPYANQGSVVGKARLSPGAPGYAQVTVAEGSGPYWFTAVADATGAFEMRATTEPARSNNWGVAVFRAPGATTGGGTRPLKFTMVGFPDSNQSITVENSKQSDVSLSATKTYAQPPCEPCRQRERASGAPQAPGPTNSQGKPVSVTTGEMFFSQTDGASGDLALNRTYSSAALSTGRYGMFGPGWNTTLDQRLRYPETRVIEARLPNGAPIYYYDENSDGTFEANLPLTAESWIETHGSDYKRVLRAGGFELYDSASGRIKSTQDKAGVVTTYTRDASNRITGVTRLGRTLTFTYTGTSTQPTDLRSGATVLATYAYAANLGGSPLVQVTYPDGSGYILTPDSGGRILSVSDLAGRRLEAHIYDAQGRATTSEILDGRDLLTFAYGVQQTTVTDALGNQTVFDWTILNGVRYVTKITGPCAACGTGGDSQEWTYDERGNILSYEDGLGKVSTFTYSANDEMLTSTDPLNQTTTYTYDAQGRLLTRTGPDGAVTTYVQGASGPTSITQSVTASTTRTTAIAYHAATGRPQTITDPRGKVTSMAYDGTTGDLLIVTDPLSHVTTFTYDAQGRRTKVKDALNHETTTTYDANGRVTRVTNHDGTHTDFTYDKGGRRSEVIDPLLRKTRYVYDVYGRLSAVVDPMNQTTRYGYDLMGNLTSLTDAKEQTTKFEYDGYNRVKKTIYPGGAYETFTYDAGGRLATMVDRKNVTTTYAYDDLGRLTGKAFTNDPSNTPAFSYTYDLAGRMLTAQNGTDTLTWTYNLVGELLSEQSVKNASTVAYTYDDGGNRLSVSLDGTLFVTYAYDDASRLTTITRGTNVFGFAYDDANRRTSMSYPNGVDTAYTYDNLNRLTNLAATHTSTGTPITNFGYQYDAAGNRTQKSTLDYTEDYGYDPLYRLTRADRTSPGATPPNQWTWGYDAVGNRTSAQKDSEATTSSYNERNQLTGATGGGKMLWKGTLDEPGIATFSAPTINGQPARMLAGNVFEATLDLPAGANNVTIQAQDGSGNVATKVYSVNVIGVPSSYTYDANGNLTAKTDGADSWTYAWNARGQLTGVSKNGANQATYSYDPIGRRVEEVAGSTTSTWTYDSEDVLRQNATTASVTTTTTFIHGPGMDEPMAQDTTATGATTYLHADALGSIVRQTNVAAAVTETLTYDAWGNIQSGTPSPYAFTGREWDPAAQLHYYRARYYDPRLGAFLSEDPVDFRNGLSRFAYVLGNPARLVDPTGHIPEGPKCGRDCPPEVQTAADNLCAKADDIPDVEIRECVKKKCRANLPVGCTHSACKPPLSSPGQTAPSGDKIFICAQNVPATGCIERVIAHEMTHTCRAGGPRMDPDVHERALERAKKAIVCPFK